MVVVFGDFYVICCGDKCGGGWDVDGVWVIVTGIDDIGKVVIRMWKWIGVGE